jgi:hypothetical protein
MGWILAGLFLFIAIGNLSIARGWSMRGKTGSLIPGLGALAGLAACFLLPFPVLRRRWWIPLVADLGTAHLVTATALFMITKLYKQVFRGDTH